MSNLNTNVYQSGLFQILELFFLNLIIILLKTTEFFIATRNYRINRINTDILEVFVN